MKHLFCAPAIVGFVLSVAGCGPSLPGVADAAKLEAACVARIKLECRPKDRECPAYKECRAAVEAWRVKP